ncbi:MAG: M56 family metallopeptidase [Holophagales bacterium]|nr:M56 family metallopeptidase [Holophagales bacterium]
MSEQLEAGTLFWWTWIAPSAVQAAVLIPLLALVDRLLPRRTWPQLRAALWWLVLLRLLLPPEWPGARLETLGESLGSAGWSLPTLDLQALEAATRPDLMPWAQGLFVVWMAGLVLLASGRWWGGRRLRRRWQLGALGEGPPWLAQEGREAAANLGLRRLPPIRVGAAVPAPCVLGVLRPTVYLPAALLAGTGREHVRHVLYHELAHVRRGDTRAAALASLVRTLYWFHPFVWWAERRLHRLREPCCDRTVARALGEGTAAYRRTLLLFATGQLVPAGRPPAVSLPFLRPESLLLTRLRLLEDHLERTWLRRFTTTILLAALFACSLPFTHSAERAVITVGEVIERPPGCLPLRYLVLRRLAEEEAEKRRSAENFAGPASAAPSP